MPSKTQPYTLEENLALTDRELAGNVGRLASLIRSYEVVSWRDAQRKAADLMNSDTNFEYVKSVRRAIKEGRSAPVENPQPTPPEPATKPAKQKSIYEANYDRLMELAPGLEEMLWNYQKGDRLIGRSESRGYPDWVVELLYEKKREFHFSLTHYRKVNGDSVSDPYMEILIDMKKCTVEALHYQDETHDSEVYDDKDKRSKVDEEERKSQNSFLGEWLGKLKKRRYRIEWEEEEPEPAAEEESESEIIDHYAKQKGIEVDEQKVVPTPEIPASKKSGSSSGSGNSNNKQQAKIIQMEISQPITEQRISSFVKIVDFLEFGMEGSPHQLVDRTKGIVTTVGATQYLIDHFSELIQERLNLLKSSSFFQLVFLSRRLLDFATESDLELRLVSSKSDIAYSIQGGASKSGNSLNIAIHQLDPKTNGESVLMLNLDTKKYLIGVSLVSKGVSGFPPYNPENEYPNKDVIEVVMLQHLKSWLNSLLLNQYTIIEPNLKVVAQEQEAEQSPSVPEVQKDQELEQHSEHYINEEIPDFEPGHVQLTEAHIKRGVTQAMIDRINSTGEGIVVVPRKKMIKNTKSVEMDRENLAEKPGFRLSRTGKFYTETRSNRADRTNYGL